MRLGKVCGFLMKAFLAVLMLFVTAAAMEMEVYDEDDLAYAIDEKCENIILKGEYIPLDFLDQVVIDFDTVLNLNGNKLFSYFQITNGAQVTIKNGGFTAAGDPIIEVCGSDDEERPTVLILEDLKIEASRVTAYCHRPFKFCHCARTICGRGYSSRGVSPTGKEVDRRFIVAPPFICVGQSAFAALYVFSLPRRGLRGN